MVSPTSKSTSYLLAVGFMLFALFFGAGNLIVPVMLGQNAGENLLLSGIGFVITGIGLPVLCVLALAFSRKGDLQSLASRVHPIFGVSFTVLLYLTIGPLFAIPRTNTVSYEIGIVPFLKDPDNPLPLLIFTIIFFGLTLFFSLQTTKLVNIVGKILTPILLTAIGILIIATFVNPLGDLQPPTEAYTKNSFFVGFTEGYLTMDALAAFVFGIIIINLLKEKGASTNKVIMKSSLKIALIAAGLLALVYVSLIYLGATSVEQTGYLENGGQVLAAANALYFGSFGKIILALIVIAACLTTSIGLITSCGSYFNKIIPSVSVKKWVVIFTVFSAVISNIGLTKIIEYSVPVLVTLYPLAICLMVLTFLHPLFKGKKEIYQYSIFFTSIIAIVDGLNAAGIKMNWITDLFNEFLPLYSVGLGWIIPAVTGGILGLIISLFRKNQGTLYQ
jgi:branched-chain amino acid:cation transporter, LIVCS family